MVCVCVCDVVAFLDRFFLALQEYYITGNYGGPAFIAYRNLFIEYFVGVDTRFVHCGMRRLHPSLSVSATSTTANPYLGINWCCCACDNRYRVTNSPLATAHIKVVRKLSRVRVA